MGYFFVNKTKWQNSVIIYDTINMIVVTPDTNTKQSFSIRTMPSASLSSFKVRLFLTNEDTNKTTSITNVTASYNSFNFLQVTASMFLTASEWYTMDVIQLSGSTDCTVLYRGELFPTTESATVRNSEPMLSYTGSSPNINDYIIY
jgi:hypothetical protein